MKKSIKYICIALTFGVLFISAGLFWPGTSSQNPHASAEFQRGMDLVNQNRFSEAIEPLTSAFEGGYIEAGYWIGFSYRYITLPLGSPKEEWLWYKKGAEAGDPYAMLALGSKYYILCSILDECSLKDYYWKWKGKKTLKQKAANEDPDAAWYLLLRAEDDYYLKNSKNKNLEYISKLKKIAKNGSDIAAVNYFYRSKEIINKEKNKAIKILKDSAMKGGVKSARVLGEQYHQLAQKSNSKSHLFNKSIHWLKIPASLGDRQAIYNLGQMYRGQTELENHIEELYYYCRIAYETGSEWVWCGPTPSEKYGQKIDVSLSEEKRKPLDCKAKKWAKENFLSRNYTYFSGFNP